VQVAVIVHQLQADRPTEEALPTEEEKECRQEGRGKGFPDALLEFFKNISDLFNSLSRITMAVPIDLRSEHLTDPTTQYGSVCGSVCVGGFRGRVSVRGENIPFL